MLTWRTAVLFRRPSKAFEDALAGGGIGLRVLSLRGAIVDNMQIIGLIT